MLLPSLNKGFSLPILLRLFDFMCNIVAHELCKKLRQPYRLVELFRYVRKIPVRVCDKVCV